MPVYLTLPQFNMQHPDPQVFFRQEGRRVQMLPIEVRVWSNRTTEKACKNLTHTHTHTHTHRSVSLTHTHTQAHTYRRTHTHTHTHTPPPFPRLATHTHTTTAH